MQRPNLLRRRLLEGRKAFGLWVHTAHPAVTEAMAAAGYDFLFLDNEHGPGSLKDTLIQLQILASGATSPVVRVPSNDPVYLKRVLDIGASSIMIPMIETAEQAKAAAEKARARLMDAIESISEGFCLYDADDRLVLANHKYNEIYPELAPFRVPGARFADIVRLAAERGLVPEAEGRIDAWVAERVAYHHNPSGVIEQQLADGRWVRISKRRTSEGGIVSVFTDISPLKERETQLAELVKSLEVARDQANQASAAASSPPAARASRYVVPVA